MVGQPLADQARGDVDAAAGGETCDDFCRPCRIVERDARCGKAGIAMSAPASLRKFRRKRSFMLSAPLLAASLSQLPRPE
jgi:hypothetical protein